MWTAFKWSCPFILLKGTCAQTLQALACQTQVLALMQGQIHVAWSLAELLQQMSWQAISRGAQLRPSVPLPLQCQHTGGLDTSIRQGVAQLHGLQ